MGVGGIGHRRGNARFQRSGQARGFEKDVGRLYGKWANKVFRCCAIGIGSNDYSLFPNTPCSRQNVGIRRTGKRNVGCIGNWIKGAASPAATFSKLRDINELLLLQVVLVSRMEALQPGHLPAPAPLPHPIQRPVAVQQPVRQYRSQLRQRSTRDQRSTSRW